MKTLLAVVLIVGTAAAAAAQETPVPDLKGRWVGTSEAVVVGNSPYHGDAPDRAKARVSSAEITLTIEGQDGRRFWGFARSRGAEEPIIGVIGFDGRTIVWQSSDGAANGTIVDGNTIEILYNHSTQENLVAAATRYKRQK